MYPMAIFVTVSRSKSGRAQTRIARTCAIEGEGGQSPPADNPRRRMLLLRVPTMSERARCRSRNDPFFSRGRHTS